MIPKEPGGNVMDILDRYPDATRDHLIPILQEVQGSFGYLSKEAIVEIGRHLKLPASKIFGVATFYNQFRFQPLGKYHFVVCRGTACHVKNSVIILQTLEETLKIRAGETTRDGLFSLEVVACLGMCGLSPVMVVNEEFHAKVTPQKVKKIIRELQDKENENAEDNQWKRSGGVSRPAAEGNEVEAN